MGRGVFIIGGNNNRVYEDVTGLVAINCTGETFTSEDAGKIIGANRKLIVDENGVSISFSHATITSSTTIGAGNKPLYYVDATGGDIDITMQHDANFPILFIQIDASGNDANLIADTGTINGLAQDTIGGQYQRANVVSNGTDFYK